MTSVSFSSRIQNHMRHFVTKQKLTHHCKAIILHKDAKKNNNNNHMRSRLRYQATEDQKGRFREHINCITRLKCVASVWFLELSLQFKSTMLPESADCTPVSSPHIQEHASLCGKADAQ